MADYGKSKKPFSNVFFSEDGRQSDGLELTYAYVDVRSVHEIETLGTPVVFVAATTAPDPVVPAHFEPFVSQSIPAVDSTLPNRTCVVGVTAGVREKGDAGKIIPTANGTKMLIGFRNASVVEQEIVFNSSTNATNKGNFLAALEKQGIHVKQKATVAEPSYEA